MKGNRTVARGELREGFKSKRDLRLFITLKENGGNGEYGKYLRDSSW